AWCEPTTHWTESRNAPCFGFTFAAGANSVTSLSAGMLLRLGGEVVRVLAVDSNAKKLTVQRGVAGTRPAVHLTGAGLFLAADQRGVLRPRDGNSDGTPVVDIGAF